MRLLMALFAAFALSWPVCAEVVIYPAPSGEELSSDYRVSVAGRDVAVYTARTLDPPFAGKQWDYGGPYSFASFDTDEPVEVRITSPRNLRNTVIRPSYPDVRLQVVNEHEMVVILP